MTYRIAQKHNRSALVLYTCEHYHGCYPYVQNILDILGKFEKWMKSMRFVEYVLVIVIGGKI